MSGHIPVLVKEVVEVLAPQDGLIYVDGTFGAGGYTEALLKAAHCFVIAIDRDPDAVQAGQKMRAQYGDRLRILQGRFGDIADLLAAEKIDQVAGLTLDLGTSSMQLDQALRGFSFRFDGPLDMRMEKTGATAADLVNELEERPLADLIFTFGEERRARAIARAIVSKRAISPITTTFELAEIVRRAVGPTKDRHIDPATRTFQALRIAVNDEMGEIDRALAAAEQILMPGGRIAIVTFHSLEDRRVKSFLREKAGKQGNLSRHHPFGRGPAQPAFRLLHSKGVVPGAEELAVNPRSRSARLRAAEKIESREAA